MSANTTLADLAWFQRLPVEERVIVRRLATAVAEESVNQIDDFVDKMPVGAYLDSEVLREAVDYDQALREVGIA